MNTALKLHAQKKQRLLDSLRRARQNKTSAAVNLDKKTSNLFRHRGTSDSQRRGQAPVVSLKDFNQVIKIDPDKKIAYVEGLTTYQDLTQACLVHNLMPTIVPELKSITVGGAVSGVGIESAAFRFGLVHESMLEAEVLLANDQIVTARGDNEYADLFYALPNSYGTLGYIVSLKMRLTPIKKFVRLNHIHYSDPVAYFAALDKIIREQKKINGGNKTIDAPKERTDDKIMAAPDSLDTADKGYLERSELDGNARSRAVGTENDPGGSDERPPSIDFLDGTVFGPNEMYITTGTFVDHAPRVSDYTYMNIYYKSIRRKKIDYLTARDYIWRWDTDWFWCSAHFGAQNPFLRLLYGRKRLNSVNYWRIRAWYAKLTGHTDAKTAGQSNRAGSASAESSGNDPLPPNALQKKESVVQDVEIPLVRAAEFLEFFQEKIGIKPIWVCPLTAGPRADKFTLYPFKPGGVYINFGFWDVVKSRVPRPAGWYNRLIEQKVRQLGGKKSLYSTSFYSPREFWELFDHTAYKRLKNKYDPDRKFKDLYDKTVKAL